MNGPGENGREAKPRAGAAGLKIEHVQLTRAADGLARSLAAALDRRPVDPDDFAQVVTSRLDETEHQLAQLARSIDRMNRRLATMESRLMSLASQASDQEEALRMMCEVLRDLDDPYGFGESLDERFARRGFDCTTEGEDE